ncbi:MAG: PD-(D/E)XK nuclease family protein, partial [Candidatus Saccharimonadales bacterium]
HMTSPLHDYYIQKGEITNDYLHGLSAIRMLRDLVTEFSHTTDDTAVSLTDFIAFISINQQNNRGITDESPFVIEGRSVELYTVHKAKGLEFDQVFIVDAVEDAWKPRIAGRKPPANLPLQPPGEHEDDYIRLLYVAATRAKHSLFVTSYQFDSSGKDILATPFIRQAIPEATVSQQTEVSVVTILEENLRWPRLNSKDEKTLLRGRLTNYNLSATHLLTFLDVAKAGPQVFLERHILRLPTAKTEHMGFGNAMHSAMQFAQKLTNQDKFAVEPILQEYERALRFEHLLPTDYEKYLLHGQDTLRKLFEAENYRLPKGSLAEQQMRDIRIQEACLSGTIDRIDGSGNSVVIADYKTGQPLASFTTRDQTKAIKAWRHKYQLIFYALLLKQHPSFTNVTDIDCQMVYLEAETGKDLIRDYQPSNQEIEQMQALVQVVWKKVLNLEFPDIAKYPPDMTGIAEFEADLLGEA